MAAKECYDGIRYSLSDKDGVLRFDAFEIVGAPECRHVSEALKEYLIGRALDDVDLGYLCTLACAENGACIRAVLRAVKECQQSFSR